MSRLGLLARSVRWYGRSNLAVVLGVATAVGVLGGALVVGESVRWSLRELALRRLGRVAQAVQSRRFFREALASELAVGRAAAPILSLAGNVLDEASGRRAYGVAVYGVDERFWSLQAVPAPAVARGARDVFLSPALRAELGVQDGASLLLRVDAPGEVSAATLYGSRDDVGRTLRATARRAPDAAAEFSLRGSQRAVLAAFVPLSLLQRTLKHEARANGVVLTGDAEVEAALRTAARLPDFGLKLRVLAPRRALSLESEEALLSDTVVTAARQTAERHHLDASPLLTYLANTLSVGERAVPYSLVSGVAAEEFDALAKRASARVVAPGREPILLNDWTARELGAAAGQPLRLTYFVWEEAGKLVERRAEFDVAGTVPLEAGDRDMTPDYPGITESLHLADWNPPFPVDLKRVRPRDEEYWTRYKGTPKAFVRLERAQALWGHRLGKLTSLRLRVSGDDLNEARRAYERELLASLDPVRNGFQVVAARQDVLAASRGSTDFDEYFLYFSVFLIASALLLVGLFFRLGVEQRLQEIGLLRSLGFTPGQLLRQFVGEALLLSVVGSLPGIPLAAGFAAAVLFLLGQFGGDAIGTQALVVHVAPGTLIPGALAGVLVATLTSATAVRGLLRREPRPLLLGVLVEPSSRLRRGARSWLWGVLGVGVALGLAGTSANGVLDPVAGFFGAGAASLFAGLAFTRRWLQRRDRAVAKNVAALGVRAVSQRPGRSLLSIALVASATFVVVALGAFRRPGPSGSDPKSGTGGYALVGESLLPIHYDFGTDEGPRQLGFLGADAEAVARARVARLRLRPGDDASCLNLYLPQSPRVLGAPAAFGREARFAFAGSVAESVAERANPWLLLEHSSVPPEFPAIADQNSIEYVLHSKLGGAFEMDTPGAGRVRLRLVAALRGSLFQSELIVSEAAFQRMFPAESGYRVFLLDASAADAAALTGVLESRLADSGLDLQPAAERLERYLNVEHMYIATFQLLGGLGLLLGTAGLATVILRNAAERRRELGLLRAVGFQAAHLRTLALAENAVLLVTGLAIGSLCALIAVVPAAGVRSAQAPVTELGALLGGVLLIGLGAAWLAVRLASRGDVLLALRTD
jgi:ABC-type lipoprotein release transport system permease subunit